MKLVKVSKRHLLTLLSPALLFTLILTLFSNITLGQKSVIASGTYSMKIERNISIESAENKCLELARIDAIRNVFGDVIIQGNSTYIKNSSGEKVETQNVFNFYSDTYVNGEWLKDIEPPVIKRLLHDNENWISVSVKCLVQPLKQNIIKFNAFFTSCPDIKCSTEKFNDGQDFYIIFKSPIEGKLSIFIDVPSDKTTYRILPYKKYSSASSVNIEADKEYIFFSKTKNYFGDANGIDELVMSLSDEKIPEINKIFILFSTSSDINKPFLNNTASTNSQKDIIKSNYEIPLYLDSEKFQEWLLNIRNRNRDLEFKSYQVDITPQRN